MTAPSVYPVEYECYSQISTLLATISKDGGYYFDAGEVNVFDVAMVKCYPRYLVKLLDEVTESVDNCHYYNSQNIEIVCEWANSDLEPNDGYIIQASQMVHDIKKLFGNYYALSDQGNFNIVYTGHTKIYDGNCELPVSVRCFLTSNWYENRVTPALSLGV